MFPQILRTVLAALRYPTIPEGIPVLIQEDVIRNERVLVRDGVKHVGDLDFMDLTLGVTAATEACNVSELAINILGDTDAARTLNDTTKECASIDHRPLVSCHGGSINLKQYFILHVVCDTTLMVTPCRDSLDTWHPESTRLTARMTE